MAVQAVQAGSILLALLEIWVRCSIPYFWRRAQNLHQVSQIHLLCRKAIVWINY